MFHYIKQLLLFPLSFLAGFLIFTFHGIDLEFEDYFFKKLHPGDLLDCDYVICGSLSLFGALYLAYLKLFFKQLEEEIDFFNFFGLQKLAYFVHSIVIPLKFEATRNQNLLPHLKNKQLKHKQLKILVFPFDKPVYKQQAFIKSIC